MPDDLFRIEMVVPSDGTIVTKTSDGIADKLARIKTSLNGPDEAIRNLERSREEPEAHSP